MHLEDAYDYTSRLMANNALKEDAKEGIASFRKRNPSWRNKLNDPLSLKSFIRTVDDFPIEGIKFRDITSLIESPEAFKKHAMSLQE